MPSGSRRAAAFAVAAASLMSARWTALADPLSQSVGAAPRGSLASDTNFITFRSVSSLFPDTALAALAEGGVFFASTSPPDVCLARLLSAAEGDACRNRDAGKRIHLASSSSGRVIVPGSTHKVFRN